MLSNGQGNAEMKYDQEYLKTLYESHNLKDFLKLVNEDKIDDPHVRAIISTLRRSVRTLNLHFNPISINTIQEKRPKTNRLH